jgi:hypothetical protein
MAHRFTLQVEVEVERESGLFASRDEIADELISALEGADPGDISGIGSNGDSAYSVTSWEVSDVSS